MYTANLDDCSQKQGNEDEPNRVENHSINQKKQWCAEKESREILMLKKKNNIQSTKKEWSQVLLHPVHVPGRLVAAIKAAFRHS